MRFARALWLAASFVLASVGVAGEVRHSEGVPAADGLRSYVAPPANDAIFVLPGTYSFEVEVLPNGDVAAIRTDPCGILMPEVLGKLARGWKFVPFEGASSRWRRLTYVFESEIETMEESRIETWYESPLTLYVQLIQSIVGRCPRVNGKVAQKVCPVHKETMHIEVLPVRYSGPPTGGRPGETEYIQAFLDQFPNSGEFVQKGDDIMVPVMQFEEVFICASCTKARRAWLAAHEGFTPPN